jgi:hypothetical protein
MVQLLTEWIHFNGAEKNLKGAWVVMHSGNKINLFFSHVFR